MKPPTAEHFPASVVSLLGICSCMASTAALTIPAISSLDIANTSHLLPPSLNATSLSAHNFEPHCAPSDDDDTWYNEPTPVKWRYDTTCYEALLLFAKEYERYGEEEFEFFAPEAKATTSLRRAQTPRRYTVGGSGANPNPSCTVIVAMLDFASAGQLPEQPPGPFQPTDVSSFEDLVNAGGEVLTQCVRARGVGILPDLHFGWVQAGQGGNVGVFFTGTKSQIDRSIPRGVHP